MAFVNVNFKKLYCGDLNCSDKELRLKTGVWPRKADVYVFDFRACGDRQGEAAPRQKTACTMAGFGRPFNPGCPDSEAG